jgi:hypothetical protein
VVIEVSLRKFGSSNYSQGFVAVGILLLPLAAPYLTCNYLKLLEKERDVKIYGTSRGCY